MKNILIFKIGAIWDVLMTTPLIRQLKEKLPNINIDYIVWNTASQVLKNNPYINELITFDDKIFVKKDLIKIIKLINKIRNLHKIKKYESIIILDKHWIFKFIWFLTWIKNRFGFNRLWKEWLFLTWSIYYDKSKREVEYYLEFLNFFGITPNYKKQKYTFVISEETKKSKKVTQFLKQIKSNWKKNIAIATWWGNPLMPKNDCRWRDIKNWEKLAIKLLNHGFNVILLWSKNDRKLNINHPNFFNWLWKFSIEETTYIIENLDFVISQEAWFIHFVWCTDTPLLTIAGPTNPRRFHPFTDSWQPHPIWWIWKEKEECYDVYGSYDKCKGNEINKISVDEVFIKFIATFNQKI